MEDLISVIIPTYHNRGGLKQSIDSVLQQEGVNIEIIVVDDNNPDTEWRRITEEEMRTYADDSRVVYVQHSINRNGAVARNTGITASSGNYIAFLDDDDIYLPGKLKAQLCFLKNHSDYNCVYGQMLRSGKIVADNLPEGDLSRDLLLLKTHLQTSTLMFRTDAIRGIGGFDESFYRHQDYEMLLRYFAAGNLIGAIQIPVSEFGRNNGENIPTGEKLESIKMKFLATFDSYISKFDSITPGYKKAVYATHYSGIFLGYLKSKDLLKCLRIMLVYSVSSPFNFWRPIIKSIKKHILRSY